MKSIFYIIGFLFLLVACRPTNEKKQSPPAANPPGGAPDSLPKAVGTLVLSSPASSPNYVSSPTFIASNGVVSGDEVGLYSDDACSLVLGSAKATGTSVSITTSPLAIGTTALYSKSKNQSGFGPCSAQLGSYQYLGVSPTVLVSWTANREKGVNKVGGGYLVYYSRTSGFNTSSASFKNVPYVSGPAAPTTTSFTDLLAGTTYFKVVAYSSLNAPGSTAGSKSSASSEFSVTLP